MQIRFAALLFICLFAGLFALVWDQTTSAVTTVPTKMNFQGRVTNSAGNILANGTYNMKFKLWSAASGGTQQWSEDRLVSAGQGVVVTNGQFSVQLGSVTSLPASVFASDSLYFEVELPTPASATTSSPVWTEGAMTPRNQLATSAYAYNSETLDGLDSAAFGQLDQNNVFTGNNTFNGTLQGGSSLTLGTSSAQGSLVLNDGNGQTGTLVMADTAGSYTYTIPVTTANDTFCLATLANCADGGVTAVGALDGGTANASAATISGSTIFLQSASATYAGMVNTTTQSFAGNKTFTGTVTVSGTTTLDDNVTVAADKSIQFVGGATGTRPASPAEGMVYYDTTTKQLQTYANGKWQADRTEAVIVAASDSSQTDKDAADYVADGDTVAAADGDQIEINAALTAASGKKVILLAGTYVADATVLIPNYTTLDGVGQGTVIELADLDATDTLIENSDTTAGMGISIKNLKIDGRSDLNTSGTQRGIQTTSVGQVTGAASGQGLEITNVTIVRMRDSGIFLQNTARSTVSNSTLRNNGSVGSYALKMNGTSSQYNVVTNNIVENNYAGISVGFGSYNTITSNMVETAASAAIELISGASNNTIANNNIYAAGVNLGAISLQSAHSNVISANRVTNSGGTNLNNGIYVATADSNMISNNVISDSSATTNNYAVNISNSTSDTNYLSDNTLGGGSITDLGTGTIYAGQTDASGNLTIQPAANINLNKNTIISSGSLTLGNTTTAGALTVSDGSSNTATIAIGSLAGNYTYTIPVTTANDTFCLATLANCAGGGGVTTVGALDGGTANATGASIVGSTMYLQSASATNAGLVNTTTQSFAGNKTFTGTVTVSGATTLNDSVTVAANKSIQFVGGATGTRPASPAEGMVYYDTTTKQLLTYANGKWQADRTDTVLVAASNSTQADKDAADYVADGNTGAAADGDQVQINAALTAGAGKKVVLLAGTYVADASISIPNDTILAGVGNSTNLELAALGGNDELIVNTDTTTGSSVGIRDLSLNGRGNDLNTGVTTALVSMTNMGGGSGASIRSGAAVSNVRFLNANNGMYMESSANSHITNNNFSAAGIYAWLSNNNTYSGNRIDQGYTEFDSSSQNTITGNIIANATSFGVGLSFGASDNVFSDNVVHSNGTRGLQIIQANSNVVSGNRFYDNGSSTANDSIYVQTSDSNTITGNSITDASATTTNYAINISDSGSDTSYLASNTLGGGSINDAGTGTIYASQVDASGNLTIQPAANINLNKDTIVSSGSLTLGNASTAGNLKVSDGSSNTATLAIAPTLGNYTYTIPVTTANDTFCLVTLANCADGGVTAVGALDGGTPNADGATISGSTVYLQSASATDAGLINTTTQTFAGNKTFNGTLTVANSASFSGQLTIGTSDTTGTLLVLDTKTDAGDPAGTNGAMYYNSSLSKFRCYEGSAWRNCSNSAAMSATTVPGAWSATVAKSATATILVSPVYISGPMTVNTMRIRITTALGAAGDVGIYNSAGSLVLNGGSSSLATTTGIKSVAPTQSGTARILQPGQYFVAVTWNSTTGIIAGANLGLAGTMGYTGTLASGGGLVLPSSITPASITETTYLYGVSLNQ